MVFYDLMTSMSLNGNFYSLYLVERQTMNNSRKKMLENCLCEKNRK